VGELCVCAGDLLNYKRINNARNVRKKTFVLYYYYVAVVQLLVRAVASGVAVVPASPV